MRFPRKSVALVCEDLQHACFVRYFLQAYGVRLREFRQDFTPRRSGSGVDYVVRKFPQWLREHQHKRGHLRDLILVAMMDADTADRAYRLRQLREACREARLDFDPENEDRVAVITPRRNIETWNEFLKGRVVDEATDCHPVVRALESECRPQAVRLADSCKKQEPLPGTPPPSLQQACEEFRTRFAQWL